MKKTLIWIAVACLAAGALHAEKLTTLTDHLKPVMLVMDSDRFYVLENSEISIYSLKDYKRIAKFGKRGEGPKEFKTQPGAPGEGMSIIPQKDHIFINCIGKVLRFAKNGEFIDETSTGSAYISALQPVGQYYAGLLTGFDPNAGSMSLSSVIYDKKFNKIRDLSVSKIMNNNRMEQPQVSPYFGLVGDQIVIVSGETFVVDVFDVEGRKVRTIKREYTPGDVTETWKKRYFRLLEEALKPYPGLFEQFKKTVSFKPKFPAIQFCLTANDTIYVFTYLEKDKKTECFIFNNKGEFKKQVFLPFNTESLSAIFLQGIENNRYYRLIQDEESEDWVLHSDPIM